MVKSNWIPPINSESQEVNIECWIDVTKTDRIRDAKNPGKDLSCRVKSEIYTRTEKIRIWLTLEQITIIQDWFECFRLMYNATIDIIDPLIFKNDMIVENYSEILKKKVIAPLMSDIKESFRRNDSGTEATVPAHLLDQAIIRCIGAYKSSITNHERRVEMAAHREKIRRQVAEEKRLAREKQAAENIVNDNKKLRKANANTSPKKASEVKSKSKQKIVNKPQTIKDKAVKKSKSTKERPKRPAKRELKGQPRKEPRKKPFVMNYLSKNKRTKWMSIDGDDFKGNNSFYPSIMGEIKSSVSFNTKRTSILTYDRYTSKYILHVPREMDQKHHKTRNLKCGIDAGIRTFLTVYSKEECYEIGDGLDFKSYFERIDRIRELYNDHKINKNKYKRCLAKVSDKMKHRIKDMQYKVAKMLCEKYSEIRIGILNVKSIIKRRQYTDKSKKQTPLSSYNKRKLLLLSHAKFREILKFQGKKYGTKVLEVSEYKTTKTCSQCGHENEMGKEKIFFCVACELVAGRDINAARNMSYREEKKKFSMAKKPKRTKAAERELEEQRKEKRKLRKKRLKDKAKEETKVQR